MVNTRKLPKFTTMTNKNNNKNYTIHVFTIIYLQPQSFGINRNKNVLKTYRPDLMFSKH